MKLGGNNIDEDLTAPLAELARPKKLEEFFGQDAIMSEDSLLRDLIEAGRCPSLILWGGPGCGKTTLARLIGTHAPWYRELSAVKDNVADLKAAMEKAAGYKRMHPEERRPPVIFLDEIHRFNRAQQDALLGSVERGDFTLLAATTENPSFRIVSALLSRCRTIVLKSLAVPVLEQILVRAAEIQAKRLAINVEWEENVLHRLATACDGDARSAINAVQMVVEATLAGNQRRQKKLADSKDDSLVTTSDETAGESVPVPDSRPVVNIIITAERVLSALQKSHLLYDTSGDGHYDTISALHKSIRGSDADAALYWMGRMLFAGEDPLFIVRRLIRCASEDIGLADPQALVMATATWNSVTYIGMPEAGVCIAQLVVYLARAPKSVEVYKALDRVREAVTTEVAYPVPLHLRNAPTGLMKDLGYGAGYKVG
jgi:putative ATPase